MHGPLQSDTVIMFKNKLKYIIATFCFSNKSSDFPVCLPNLSDVPITLNSMH